MRYLFSLAFLALVNACAYPTSKVDGPDTEDTDCDTDTDADTDSDSDTDADTDTGADTTWYRDLDGDGFGDPNLKVEATTVPDGYVADDTDCDDTKAEVNPDAEEVCNDIDDDCDGDTDEGCDEEVLCTINVDWTVPGSEAADILTLSMEVDDNYTGWDEIWSVEYEVGISVEFQAYLSASSDLRYNVTYQFESEPYFVRYGCESTTEDEADDQLVGTHQVVVECEDGSSSDPVISIYHKTTGVVDGCEAQVLDILP
ncbi:MAG: MopE-related protein [Patescibacteria group bacterium]|jgi:hypothetical protein